MSAKHIVKDGIVVAKQCSTCRKMLNLESFSKSKRGLGGRQPKCKDCYRNYVSEHKEAVSQCKDRWYSKNKENLSEIRKKQYKEKKLKGEIVVSYTVPTYEEVKEYFQKQGCELLENKYKNANERMKYKCSCGNTSFTRYGDFKAGKRCKECGYKKIKKLNSLKYSEVKKEVESKGFSLLSYSDCYNVEVKCSRGHVTTRRIGNIRLWGCRKCADEDTLKGENNHAWNPKLTYEERLLGRNYPQYREWLKKVYERDGYTCACCEIRGGKLNAHHLDGYHWYKEGRTDINNGVTLCKKCHKNFHNIYGYELNTRQQYEEWLPQRRAELGLNEIGNRSTTEEKEQAVI